MSYGKDSMYNGTAVIHDEGLIFPRYPPHKISDGRGRSTRRTESE